MAGLIEMSRENLGKDGKTDLINSGNIVLTVGDGRKVNNAAI